MGVTDLNRFNNSWYKPGSAIKRSVWYLVNVIFFQSYLFPFSSVKITILRLFGAQIGNGVVIKPGVNIKYPWFLDIGNNSWIGEGVWIDNLAQVEIGANCCISQGALLLTGNHDYSKSTFDLMTDAIRLEDGVWIGAMSRVIPGAICQTHSVLSMGSVSPKEMEAYTIYQGNPAMPRRKREVNEG